MSDPPRRWFRFRFRTLLVLTMLAVIGLSLYSYWADYLDQSTRRQRELLSPARGAHCTVVLRRELLDIEGTDPGRAERDGVANSVGGLFVMMNDQWIVLGGQSAGQPQQWVPREHVLLLRVESP